MSFWASQQLLANLPRLIDGFSEKSIDCNAYTLRIGEEIYVSPNDQAQNPRTTTVRKLADDESFAIPPGQFALLTTEEVVRVPPNAMAFISMKAKIKFRGLINVSGFHVDPGYEGRLVFSVFNAGPSSVHMKRGQDCFLIWYASLVEESVEMKKSRAKVHLPDLVNAMPNEIQSLEGLSKRIQDLEKRLQEKINRLEPKTAELLTKATILITVGTAIALMLIKIAFD